MLSRYTNTPQYPERFKSMMILKKEIETATKKDTKEWILSSLRSSIGVHIMSILKNGIFSASNLDTNTMNELLISLQHIKNKNNESDDVNDADNDIDIDIRIPSPPPFEFDNADENTPNPSSSSSGDHAPKDDKKEKEKDKEKKTKKTLFSLSNKLISSICSYNDLQSLLKFEKCCKRIYIIAHEPDSYHNNELIFRYSFILHDSIDLLPKSLPRFYKTRLISIDHYGKYDGNDKNLWKSVIDEIFNNFTNLQTFIFGVDWIGIEYLTQIIKQKQDKLTLKNITIKHRLQKETKKKALKQKSRSKTRSKQKEEKRENDKNKNEEKIYWERTKKEEITEISISECLMLSALLSSFKYLNNLTFDMVRFPPIFEIFNVLRSIPIECIAFNDCVELGFFDDNNFIYPSISNRKPLKCESIIIRDIDQNTFDEFFDPESCSYFWPLKTLKNLMIHWNITKRDYDKFINSNKSRIIGDKLPNLSNVEILYISIINSNGIKSLILFLNESRLTLHLKMLVLRIPRNAAKAQIALNTDLSRLINILNGNKLLHLRLEIIEFSWISIWNTLNVIASHCGLKDGFGTPQTEENLNFISKTTKINTLKLETLEIHLYSPWNNKHNKHKHNKYINKHKNDTKDLIIKILHSISRLNNLNFLAIFINESSDIDQDIINEFEKNKFKKDNNNWNKLSFIRTKNKNIKRNTCHMDQYWEPVGIDPYDNQYYA